MTDDTPTAPADLRTVAEESGYRRTSLHTDVLEFVARLEQRCEDPGAEANAGRPVELVLRGHSQGRIPV